MNMVEKTLHPRDNSTRYSLQAMHERIWGTSRTRAYSQSTMDIDKC